MYSLMLSSRSLRILCVRCGKTLLHLKLLPSRKIYRNPAMAGQRIRKEREESTKAQVPLT
jgi:hypothetical protein